MIPRQSSRSTTYSAAPLTGGTSGAPGFVLCCILALVLHPTVNLSLLPPCRPRPHLLDPAIDHFHPGLRLRLQPRPVLDLLLCSASFAPSPPVSSGLIHDHLFCPLLTCLDPPSTPCSISPLHSKSLYLCTIINITIVSISSNHTQPRLGFIGFTAFSLFPDFAVGLTVASSLTRPWSLFST